LGAQTRLSALIERKSNFAAATNAANHPFFGVVIFPLDMRKAEMSAPSAGALGAAASWSKN